MDNKILKTANQIRIEAERKLQDVFNDDQKLIGLEISVEIKIDNIPADEMPANSEQRIFEKGSDAYLVFDIRDKLRFTSETYEVLIPENDGK